MTTMGKAIKGLVALVFMPHSFGSAETNRPLSGEAARGICSASRMLKSGVYRHVLTKTEAVEKMMEKVSHMGNYAKLKVLRSNSSGFECTKAKVFITYTLEGKKAMIRKLVKKLWDVGTKLVAAASLAAGRLDEMLSVFVGPIGGNDNNSYCVKDRQNFTGCFGTASFDGTGASEDGGFDGDGKEFATMLDEALQLNNTDPLESSGANCHLTKGGNGGGYLVHMDSRNKGYKIEPTKHITWGDGMLGIKKGGEASSGAKGTVRGSSYSSDVVWEEHPTKTVPTLTSTAKLFGEFQKINKEVLAVVEDALESLQEKNMTTSKDTSGSGKRLLDYMIRRCGNFTHKRQKNFFGDSAVHSHGDWRVRLVISLVAAMV
ncbi:procyclin-associated 4 (PAG4) protein [Trypanosoma brucei equiperdum]|uniref:Procyclin-associated 4 (PAG4) protein n=1 Tax=Trypanosoma brucei equiperdum TaxID=630700 RepID=A0A3L6L2T1_9TRYP|nr:procyclin-associated 4 (PAG4) protein [Trypanosoma brucei equiperdum]